MGCELSDRSKGSSARRPRGGVREALGWGLRRNTNPDQKFFDDSLALKLSISVRFESHSNVARKGLNRPPPEARKYRNSHPELHSP